MPLDLLRNRTYAASMLATFFVSFGVLRRDHLPAALVPGRPRRQRDRRPGYEIFPLLIGLIGSSIVGGLIVSRTGRYKVLIIAGLVIMTIGIALMTQLTGGHAAADPVALDVRHRPRHRARPSRCSRSSSRTPCRSTSSAWRPRNLTFFRQIGGTVGLAHRRARSSGRRSRTSCPRSSGRCSPRSRRPRRLRSRPSSTSSRPAAEPGSTSTT